MSGKGDWDGEERDHVGNFAMQRKMTNEVRMNYSS